MSDQPSTIEYLRTCRQRVEAMRLEILAMVEHERIESGVTRISGTHAANQLGVFSSDLLLEGHAERARAEHREDAARRGRALAAMPEEAP